MFSNPFAELAVSISPGIIQTYAVLMIICVVGGTIYDVLHKRSAKYFFTNWKKSQSTGDRQVGNGEIVSLAVKTAASEVLTSSEFCNQNRRISHLLGMYGFILYVLASAIMIFCYSTSVSAGIWPFLWTVGALMICAGGYWFWFAIRVDVAAEGNPWWRIVRADLFILSLVASATFGLLWSWTGSTLLLILYIIATTVLFGGVPWSKFSHMFFKPAAALEKRLSYANGSAMNLPTQTRDDPEQRKRHSMQLLQDAPMDMGLGIKREEPRHY